jgi:poly(A) polymerase
VSTGRRASAAPGRALNLWHMAFAIPDSDGSTRAAFADLLAEDSAVLELAERFRSHGHELYLVGGAVRDALLGRPHGDLDFATDAPPERTLELVDASASTVWLQGMSFGTVGAEVAGTRLEITTFRTERYAPVSRHPQVTYESDIRADLSRRDFTINAIALRLPQREPTDPFGGVKDIAARLIKTPVDAEVSFRDDPLRMLRAFRFMSQLDFRIADEVLDTIARLKEQIATVSAERIQEELTKLVLGERPGAALRSAIDVGLAQLFIPELAELRLEQDPQHRHKDVFAHTLAVVERTPTNRELRLAALLHDIGKPRTRRIGPDGVSFHQHEVVGAHMAKARLRALRYPNEVVDTVGELIRLHHRFHTYSLGWSDSAVRRYVKDAGALLGALNDLVRADCTTRNPQRARQLAARMDELEGRIADLAAQEEIARIRPELDGHEVMAFLGVPPGPVVGDALAHLLEIRLDEGLIGKDEAYKRLEAWAHERGIAAGSPSSQDPG